MAAMYGHQCKAENLMIPGQDFCDIVIVFENKCIKSLTFVTSTVRMSNYTHSLRQYVNFQLTNTELFQVMMSAASYTQSQLYAEEHYPCRPLPCEQAIHLQIYVSVQWNSNGGD